jgi:PD-(D/E)XK nuclease superfamily protein
MAGCDLAVSRARTAPAEQALSASCEIADQWRVVDRVWQGRQVKGFEGRDRTRPTAGSRAFALRGDDTSAARARDRARSGNFHHDRWKSAQDRPTAPAHSQRGCLLWPVRRVHQEALSPPATQSEAKIDIPSSGELKHATKRASEFVRKFTPSALDPDVPVEIELTSRPNNLATLYGRWWHKFLERVDWKGGAEAAQKLFEQQLPSSPAPESAKKHWSVTRKNLFSDPTIMKFVARDETQFHREFPFSWRRNDRSVVEGLIDALMIDRANGRCLLLDWKTNDVSPSEVESFRARYRPQLTAYWKAVSEITRLGVEAGLFSTALGRLLLYSPDELKSEWSRLERLPPTDLSEEIRPDAPDDL